MSPARIRARIGRPENARSVPVGTMPPGLPLRRERSYAGSGKKTEAAASPKQTVRASRNRDARCRQTRPNNCPSDEMPIGQSSESGKTAWNPVSGHTPELALFQDGNRRCAFCEADGNGRPERSAKCRTNGSDNRPERPELILSGKSAKFVFTLSVAAIAFRRAGPKTIDMYIAIAGNIGSGKTSLTGIRGRAPKPISRRATIPISAISTTI